MLTVIVALVGSGNSSTRSPLESRYSVMPSTVVIFCGACANAATEAKREAKTRRAETAVVLILIDFRMLSPFREAPNHRSALRTRHDNGDSASHREFPARY